MFDSTTINLAANKFPPAKQVADGGYFEIVSTAQYLPSINKTTAQLLQENGFSLKEAIVVRSTGVETRHIAESGWSDSDVLAYAAQRCLDHGGVSVDSLSKIFVNKLLGDRILPPTSSLVQKKLKAGVAVQSIDIDGGSHSFVQALLLAGRCLDGGDDTILIASGGIHQKLMNDNDARTALLFGDASTSVLLQASEEKHLLAQYEFSNPQLGHLHHAVDFYKFSVEFINHGELDLFSMENWKEAEEYYKTAAKHTMTVLLESAQCVPNDIDMFFVNQMNLPMWKEIVTYLKLPNEKVISVLPHTGNTLAANIPLQLNQWKNKHKDVKGKKIMMISLGEGLLGGGCIYQF